MDAIQALVSAYFVFILFLLALYVAPTIVAFSRGHEYRWVIFALNMFGGWTGLVWVAAMVWAVFPANRSFADPIVGNPTGLGRRNSGDAFGNADFGRRRGYVEEARYPTKSTIADASHSFDTIRGLKRLLDEGAITEEEFAKTKSELLK